MQELRRQTIVVVGAVAGGATAAARLRRLNEVANIILFERGEYVSFANCGLPYYIGGAIQNRNALLVQTVAGLTGRFAIDIRVKHEVVAINREVKTVVVKDLTSGATLEQPYDVLLLAPGARPIRPPVPGLADAFAAAHAFTLRSIPDTDGIKARADALLEAAKAAPGAAPPSAVVVGGGFIGIEMAEVLRERGLAVTVVELLPQVLPPLDAELASTVHAHLGEHGVALRLGVSLSGVEAGAPDAASRTLRLSDGSSVHSDLTIVAVGVQPETELARAAGLTLGARGAIVTNAHMQTSDPAIYAVGDAVLTADAALAGVADAPEPDQVWVPLGGPANRQARVAADHIAGDPAGRAATYRGTFGTAVVKVFGLTVAQTGASEKTLKRLGRPYRAVHVHPSSHAGYYPGAQPIALKLLFSPTDGRVLGAQAVGADGVDKRIDVLATALHARMTVRDLTELELCYAPPFGSAKDAVNIAGYAACNLLDGLTDNVQATTVVGPDASFELVAPGDAPAAASAMAVDGARRPAVLLDVREPGEVKAGAIPGAVNIPLPQLRARVEAGELEPVRASGVPLLVTCAVGLRGYVAGRILAQHGFPGVKNLDGGFKTFAAYAKLFAPK